MERKFTEQEIIRRKKLAFYKSLKIPLFAKTQKPMFYSSTIIKKFNSKSKEELSATKIEVTIAGRIVNQRGLFIRIKDYKGFIQAYFPKKEILEQFKLFHSLDLGDIVFIKGSLMKTQTGELTIRIAKINLLTKSLKVLPDKHYGLTNIETRSRRRYVDLIVNPDSYNTFVKRSKIMTLIRNYFNDLDYLEVDTPILQPILGGASATPFTTYHKALRMDFYLRIATELPLKKLVVGGMDRVFEIGRLFRNEGVDAIHNPEFTSIEFYEAYSNMEGMMERTEELFQYLAEKLEIPILKFKNVDISLKTPFRRVNMVQETSKHVGVALENISMDKALELAKKHHVKVEKFFKQGHIINELFEKFVEPTLIQPTFVYGYPIEISPLAAKSENDRYTQRAELFILGTEYANMFTELNDPIDQLERFENQIEQKNAGNDQANEIDMDFIEALEYGMPPAGGCGIGIDRLIMLFTNHNSIRDVLLFPHKKNK